MTVPNLTLPQPTAPLVDPLTGIITRVWWYYLQRLFYRSGGATGGSFGPPVNVDLGTSPFIFVAPSSGTLLISGGGVSRLRYSQNGTAWYPVGSFYTALPMNADASSEITYVHAPVVTFVPGP